ncbi:hypothetical protein JTE90_016588 [Oedothorax gibbosus]|uniref:Uncharacterized protein n=1 Tax=Oedothorax gibbosus TaxID=931172 RepID=A0AAV6TKF7_9ARAC|nr:hypothetical protein JTE90_016588 [Oedothorax gibbosus]
MIKCDLTISGQGPLPDLQHDLGVAEDYDCERCCVQRHHAEDVVRHSLVFGCEEIETHALLEVRMVWVPLHVEDYALRITTHEDYMMTHKYITTQIELILLSNFIKI